MIYCLVAVISLDVMKCEGGTAENAAECGEDIVRLFSAMRALIGGESLFWEHGFTAIARAEGVGKCAICGRMKRICTKWKNCGFALPLIQQ